MIRSSSSSTAFTALVRRLVDMYGNEMCGNFCRRVVTSASSERGGIMIFGMAASTFTLVHVMISLVGIVSGFVVILGLLAGRRLDRWTALFLTSTVVTSVTGFGFPFDHLLPSHKVGIISLVVLTVAILARHAFHLAGAWRWIYVVSAAIALYLNVFVFVVQAFEKVPTLKAMAPTQSEPPFLGAQLVVLALFIALTIFAVKRFRGDQPRAVRAGVGN